MDKNTISTPFGDMRILPTSGTHIRVSANGASDRPCENIVVNGVKYTASFSFVLENGTWKEQREYRYSSRCWAAGSSKSFESFSHSASKKIGECLPSIVNEWAKNNADSLKKAEIDRINSDLTDARRDRDEMRKELAQLSERCEELERNLNRLT